MGSMLGSLITLVSECTAVTFTAYMYFLRACILILKSIFLCIFIFPGYYYEYTCLNCFQKKLFSSKISFRPELQPSIHTVAVVYERIGKGVRTQLLGPSSLASTSKRGCNGVNRAGVLTKS